MLFYYIWAVSCPLFFKTDHCTATVVEVHTGTTARLSEKIMFPLVITCTRVGTELIKIETLRKFRQIIPGPGTNPTTGVTEVTIR